MHRKVQILPTCFAARRTGFTLIELILVMMIAATLLALAAPSLSNWSHGQKLRSSAEDFVALTHYARAQAVLNGTIYRVQLGDPGTFTLYMQQGTDFVATKDPQGLPVNLPTGGKAEITRTTVNTSEQPNPNLSNTSTGDSSKALDFDPTGRCPTGTVKIYDDKGQSMTVENTSPLEQFHIVSSS